MNSPFLDALIDDTTSTEELERVAVVEQPYTVKLESLLLLDTTLDEMASVRQSNWSGRPLCGAPGKIKAVDSKLADEAIAEGVRSVNPALLEADWLATRDALFYVTPRLRSVRWWRWDVVTRVRAGNTRWRFSGVLVEKADGETLDLRTSRDAATLLVGLGWRFISG